MDAADRILVYSAFLELELFPKAVFYKNEKEVKFYKKIFRSSRTEKIRKLSDVTKKAFEISQNLGLNALDALNLATAIIGNAEEFYTTEKETKPLFRCKEIKIIRI